MPLTDTKIRALKPVAKPTKHGDGGGLLLVVNPNGSKLWRMVYRYGGKQKQLAFGAWPDVSLALARAHRDAARKLLAVDVDPSQKKKQDKIAKADSAANSFEALAEEFLDKNRREGKSEATLNKKRWLISLALKDLQSKPIGEIDAADILLPLRRVEALGNYETARRLRAVISQVFRYGIATTRVSNDPTFGLRGAIIAPKVTHRAAFTEWEAFTGLIKSIWAYTGSIETRTAMKLMALLYPRPGELRQAEWTEFDLDKATWTIPEERAKMRRVHRKPLPPMAIDILREQQRHTGNLRLVFPASTSLERPISENTLNQALRRMGFEKHEATSHGFRATASTLLNESGLWNADAIEAELAHVSGNGVRRAYHRGAYWEERVRMAEWWAERIGEILGDTGN
ncbi:tyrosine-type recombinase/integrase [Rhizobium sp. NRK18]|uniref:tyrosine-type recombinase/integrase n=1 Tax=Rhizobium sp. NRK18 TaxID=2964667 RepID=UPI0021C3BD80|nr:integrase arm-type DNA-binding domain-containing protein [Rhizobium sp. NRK18]MCQ2005688.1 integrase arm-type DNA-binding domain-containing protein [Rhizobium sp. NRK18]